MKKILFGLSAFTMLFATSCQNDLDFDTTVEKTSTVSFSVGTPEIATRAYSDGTTATVLQYAVYNAAGEELTDLTVTDAEIHGSTTVNLQLTTGNTYSVIFWAAAPNAPYTVDFENKTMTVDYANAVSNDENRDAFYKYHKFTVNGAQTETIELKRPFAQLNIGTSDYAASTSAGYTPTQSAVTVKKIYKTLNLATGAVENEVEANFALADIKKDETFPVAGYEYLAMNYLLVGADKETVEVEFTYTDGSNAKTRKVGSVPVKRNYRTNIYGEILTSNVTINVEIKPEYEGNVVSVSNWEEFTAALADGNYIMLAENISYNNSYTILKSVTIDLNGKTLEITDPTKRIDIGKKNDKNAPKPNVTIKNGNLNSKVYAQTGNVELYDIKFGGTIAYAGDAQGVISVGSANLLAERCDMKNVSKSGTTKPRTFCPEGRSSGYLKLRDCNFKNSNLDRAYINPLNGSAVLELVNCSLYTMASNIDLGASYVWSNMNLTGCTGGFTFTISRASTSLTEEDIEVYRAIKQNNTGSMRFLFSDGEKNSL